MQTSNDLVGLDFVCSYFGLSASSIRRRVREAREGNNSFPLPLFRASHRLVWRRSCIENWRGEDVEVITFAPSLPQHPVQMKTSAQVRKRLEALDKLPPGEFNN